ncbi:MAG: DMT family transporter [Pseudomonadota bacterium]
MLTGVLAGLAAGALWGLVFVAPRMAPGLPAVDLTAGRFAAYGVLAAFVMLLGWRARRWPTWRQAGAAAALSVLGFTGYYFLLVLAIRDAGTEVPTLVIGTIPVWVMLLGKPESVRWRGLMPGLALTIAGLVLMTLGTPGHGPGGAGHAHFWRGMAFVVTSLICWTAFAVINSAWLKRHPEVSAADWANWLGVATGLGALALWTIAGTPLAELRQRSDIGPVLLLCASTGFGSAWLATLLWNMASQRLSASLCGQLIVSETVFALLYSFAWDGTWPSAAQWTACVLFTLGILASIKAHP